MADAKHDEKTDGKKSSKYPTWRYHDGEPQGRLVKNEEEEKSLGKGWVDTPADLSPRAIPAAVVDSDPVALAARLAGMEARLKALEAAVDPVKAPDKPKPISPRPSGAKTPEQKDDDERHTYAKTVQQTTPKIPPKDEPDVARGTPQPSGVDLVGYKPVNVSGGHGRSADAARTEKVKGKG